MWTDARIAQLKDLWADGLSAGKIASEMDGGFTRNAIIGKAHRLGLFRKANHPIGKMRRRPRRNYGSIGLTAPKVKSAKKEFAHNIRARLDGLNRVKPLPAPKPHAPTLAPPLRLSIYQLEPSSCRYPVTDNHPHAFCGHEALEGRPYCPTHAALCFNAGTAR